jgi:SOS response regulatory protein OraA/RecX
MQRLRDVGLLDDRAFADAYARELRGKGFRGPALSAKLAAKGVEGAVADALGHDSGDETDDTALLAIAMRRIRALPADEGAALRRLTGYLARRGVSAGRAFEIAKQALGQRL